MKFKFLLVLLFAGILSCVGSLDNKTLNPNCECQHDHMSIHDHMKLALVWPNSFCWTNNVKCRTSLPQFFVVKSLWAEGSGANPQQLTFCNTSSELSISMISFHKNDLLKYWPDLSTYNYDNSMPMWIKQWKTYGSCLADVLSPESYLSTALKLRQKHNMYQILRNAGIVANGNSYSTDKIISAIKRATKFTPDLVCESDTEGNVFLSEIRQCINNDGITFRDCERGMGNCDKDPVFPDPNYG